LVWCSFCTAVVTGRAKSKSQQRRIGIEGETIMEIRVVAGGIQTTEDELIVVNLFEGLEAPGGATGAVDQAVDGAIGEAIAAGDIRGNAGEVAVFYPRGAIPARRVLVVGLGPQDEFSLDGARWAAAAAAQKARALGVSSFSSIVHGGGVAFPWRRRPRQ
jgi:leucyl aminopeptidase